MFYPIEGRYVTISGRHVFEDGAAVLSWSGSGIAFRFTGDGLKLTLCCKYGPGQDYSGAYIGIWRNREKEPVLRFAVPNEKTTVMIPVTGSGDEIRIIKLTEAAYASVFLYGLETDGSVEPIPPKQRKIEFIGDSITCGFGIEGKDGIDPFRLDQENAKDAFAMKTAEALDADADLIAWSGIGVYSFYVDPEVNEPNQVWLMPAIYPYEAPGWDKLKENGMRPRDHERFVPDIIVLYLGTNDASYTRGKSSRVASFKKAYIRFLEQIRAMDPASEILCLCGAMTPALTSTIRNAVAEVSRKDEKLHYYRMPIQEQKNGIGALGHPNGYTQEKMSEFLTAEIRRIMKW